MRISTSCKCIGGIVLACSGVTATVAANIAKPKAKTKSCVEDCYHSNRGNAQIIVSPGQVTFQVNYELWAGPYNKMADLHYSFDGTTPYSSRTFHFVSSSPPPNATVLHVNDTQYPSPNWTTANIWLFWEGNCDDEHEDICNIYATHTPGSISFYKVINGQKRLLKTVDTVKNSSASYTVDL